MRHETALSGFWTLSLFRDGSCDSSHEPELSHVTASGSKGNIAKRCKPPTLPCCLSLLPPPPLHLEILQNDCRRVGQERCGPRRALRYGLQTNGQYQILWYEANPSDTASRQEMSEARLPMQYRDSCAHLLIPLNRCRQAEYYLPWKCEVRSPVTTIGAPTWTSRRAPQQTQANCGFFSCFLGRETFLREVPVRRVQEARGQDGRAAGCQGWRP